MNNIARLISSTIVAAAIAFLSAAGPQTQTLCRQLPLLDQHRDSTTILKLEGAWNAAFMSGDTALERCILTPDFAEILRNGDVKGLADELGFAAAQVGKRGVPPAVTQLAVLIHGGVAVAYGRVAGRRGATRYADFYVWESGRWLAFFAQQTPASGA